MKSFPATLDNLYPMIQYVKDNIQGFSESQFHKLEIALEEALVNVINHGFKNAQPGNITIQCLTNNDKFHVIIEDDGVAHDPLVSRRKIDPKEPLETRQPGGFGIHLITELMDEVSYERVADKNRLTLMKLKN